jgi:CRP-like cAMP-binding protein
MSTLRGRPSPGTNRLLAILPPASCERLHALGRTVPLEFQAILAHQGEAIEHVYFLSGGVASLVVLMEDGRGAEAAPVGYEGMGGAEVVLGAELSPYEITMQVGGEGLCIQSDDLRQATQDDPLLRDVLLRFAHVQMVQAARSAACNRLHELEERLARWLLQMHDWARDDHLHLTQEFLAYMLGVRRATVTVAAGTLQHAGLITYRRGDITILDRDGLEEIACEDYFAIRNAFDQLLPVPFSSQQLTEP